MRAHLGHKHKGRWDLKADEGGITDIEFITQYLVLRYAAEDPTLTRWSDNVRILELLANGDKMAQAEAQGADPGLRFAARCAAPSRFAGAAGARRGERIQRGKGPGQCQLAEVAGRLSRFRRVMMVSSKLCYHRAHNFSCLNCSLECLE